MKKYEFTGETIEFEGVTLRRIRYLKSLTGIVKIGDVGGWIESESNLSHEGRACVLDEAKVYGNARIEGNGKVLHYSRVFGNARIENIGIVKEHAIVKDNTRLLNNSCVSGHSIIGADTVIAGYSSVKGNSKVFFYESNLNDFKNEKFSPMGSIYNIFGSDIENCLIEATGCIFHTYVIGKKLDGKLSIEHQHLT